MATPPAPDVAPPRYARKKAGAHFAFARWNRQALALMLTDRLPHRPGETLGAERPLRKRRSGPSMSRAGRPVSGSVGDPTGKALARPGLTARPSERSTPR
ncbi:MAG: hypothetical protein INH41_08125 [Myxococcaceae bacterium]|nr:hypothetical protein [Myxococcaceae bacterium]MCA3012352.1 hypothetical protein [Myxococcaceae bacterium]